MPASARRKPACNPDTVFDSLRARSDYHRMTGYVPWFVAWLADLPRLVPGGSCWALIFAVLTESLGRPRDKGEPMPEWTKDLDKDWLAMVCRTDKRTVDRDLAYLESSGMAQVRHTIRGAVSIRLMFRDWPTLPDYQPQERAGSSGGSAEPKETVELVKAPRRVKAGEYSEAVKIPCAVSSFRFQAGGAVDLAFTAVVKNGQFTVSTCEVLALGETKAKHSNVSNDLTSLSRHSGLETKSFKGEEKAKWRTTGEHPRAAELAKLFDDWLLRSCHKSLSADTAALGEALDALADTPHDFLVKMVVDRARRPVSSPKVCVSICKEVRANYLKLLAAHDFVDVPGFNRMSRAEAVAQLESQIESEDDPECLQWAKRELTKLVDSGKIPPQSEQAEESKQRRKVR